MTAPTITYRAGFIDDCNVRTTTWSADHAHESGLDAHMTTDGDIFTIVGIADNAPADDEYAYYERDVSALSISTTTYPKATIRWKTSNSATAGGVGAKLVITYVGGGATTTVLDISLSTSWTVTTADLITTPAKVIDKIHIYADDSPDSYTGTSYVYVDFIMIHAGTFTWPYSPATVDVRVQNRYADLGIPGRIGDISQYLGGSNAIITLRGSIDMSTSWHGAYSFDEEYFYQIMHEMHSNFGSGNAFQWFTSDRINCKVTPRNLRIWSSGEDSNVVNYEWELHEYRLIGGENDAYTERFYDQ